MAKLCLLGATDPSPNKQASIREHCLTGSILLRQLLIAVHFRSNRFLNIHFILQQFKGLPIRLPAHNDYRFRKSKCQWRAATIIDVSKWRNRELGQRKYTVGVTGK